MRGLNPLSRGFFLSSNVISKIYTCSLKMKDVYSLGEVIVVVVVMVRVPEGDFWISAPTRMEIPIGRRISAARDESRGLCNVAVQHLHA